MQGQRSSIESLPETFEFDHGSGSRSWNNMLLDTVETQNSQGYLIPPSETDILFGDGQASGSLDIWNPAGPSSSRHPVNNTGDDTSKMDIGWVSSLRISGGNGSRINEEHQETDGMLTLGNMNINLNNSDTLQNAEHNEVRVGIGSHGSEADLCLYPHNASIFQLETASSSRSSSNVNGTSSGKVEFFQDSDVRPGNSVDGRRLSCKRKNIEGTYGQSSGGGSEVHTHQTGTHILNSNSSWDTAITLGSPHLSGNQSGFNASDEQLNSRFGTCMRGANSDSHVSVNAAGNGESSHRHFRVRVNPAHQHDTQAPYPWGSQNSSGHPTVWLPHQQYSPFLQPNQPLESRPMVSSIGSHSHPRISIIPGLPQSVQSVAGNGYLGLRTGSSSSSQVIPDESSAVSREGMNPRNMMAHNVPEHIMFSQTTDTRQLMHDPSTWSLASENINTPSNVAAPSRASITSASNHSSRRSWVPYHNHPAHHHQMLSDAALPSLFPPADPDFGVQSSNLAVQTSGHSSSSSGTSHQPGSGLRIQRQSLMRSLIAMDRQNDGGQGIPLSLRTTLVASREGRRRISEHLRNTLNLIHRGDDLRIEEILFDRAIIFGAADLYDRHRDMRLDIDNMTYEELLALEEQIGNVSTGLSEDTIMKNLKHRKYACLTGKETIEIEPCCICQEEYVEGDGVGTADCGHDFHMVCIKQWLTQKNTCPICKETALAA